MILYAFVVAKLADFGLPKLKYLIRFSSFVVFFSLMFQEVEAKDVEGKMTTVSMSNPVPVIDMSTL